jgi:hypothetical protein
MFLVLALGRRCDNLFRWSFFSLVPSGLSSRLLPSVHARVYTF